MDENVKDVYEIIANDFDDTRKAQWNWIEEFLNQFHKKSLGTSLGTSLIYDIGCGSGRNIREGMIGIDNCHNFIKICKSKDLNVILGNMDDLPLETNSGIGLICIAAFHHLKTVELRLKTLNEFKRVLFKGSKLMISVWSINQGEHKKLKFVYGDNLVPWTKHGKTHQRYYYIFMNDEIIELFEKVGLKLISHEWNHGNEIFILET